LAAKCHSTFIKQTCGTAAAVAANATVMIKELLLKQITIHIQLQLIAVLCKTVLKNFQISLFFS